MMNVKKVFPQKMNQTFDEKNIFNSGKQTLRAVLFDLDDTLYDHRHSSRAALALLQQEYPAVLGAVSLDELERANLNILNTIHIEVLNRSVDVETARRKRFFRLFSQYEMELPAEEQARVSTLYREAYRQSWRAADGAVELLTVLRGHGLKTGIISNNLVEEQMEKLRVCNLEHLIDSLTISEEAGVAKPDPRIFQIALDRLGCLPNQVVMIGDAWENDIVPARAMGIHAIWFNSYGVPAPEEHTPSLTSFSDLPATLRLIIGE
jgi:HAD superfamily hydrolase (TIGR01549 family)